MQFKDKPNNCARSLRAQSSRLVLPSLSWTHPGCRVVIQTYFSAFLHFPGTCECVRVQWKWTVCGAHSVHAHSSTHPIWHKPSVPVSLFNERRIRCFSFRFTSPLCRHASSRRRAPGARVDKCLQMHFIFISLIKSGVEHRALRWDTFVTVYYEFLAYAFMQLQPLFIHTRKMMLITRRLRFFGVSWCVVLTLWPHRCEGMPRKSKLLSGTRCDGGRENGGGECSGRFYVL